MLLPLRHKHSPLPWNSDVIMLSCYAPRRLAEWNCATAIRKWFCNEQQNNLGIWWVWIAGLSTEAREERHSQWYKAFTDYSGVTSYQLRNNSTGLIGCTELEDYGLASNNDVVTYLRMQRPLVEQYSHAWWMNLTCSRLALSSRDIPSILRTPDPFVYNMTV